MLESLRKALEEIESLDEDYPGHKDEVRRHTIVKHTLDAIHVLIDSGSNSEEEEDYLTSEVTTKLVERQHGRVASRLLAADFKRRVSDAQLPVQGSIERDG